MKLASKDICITPDRKGDQETSSVRLASLSCGTSAWDAVPDVNISFHQKEFTTETGTAIHVEQVCAGVTRYTFVIGKQAGVTTVYSLYPGVKFCVNSFDIHRIPVLSSAKRDGLIINYCCEGRCRVELGNGRVVDLEPGQVSIDVDHPVGSFQSSIGHYMGIEIFLDFDMLQEQFPMFFEDLSIQPFALRERFCRVARGTVRQMPKGVLSFSENFYRHVKLPCEYRLILAQCLKGIEYIPHECCAVKRSMLSPAQAMIVRSVESQLTADLSVRTTIESLANEYGISESSLRSYFHNMHGESISSYLKRLRMERAARLLENTDESVGSIALQVGYENQSKFASVFKDFNNISPSEYRRQSRMRLDVQMHLTENQQSVTT